MFLTFWCKIGSNRNEASLYPCLAIVVSTLGLLDVAVSTPKLLDVTVSMPKLLDVAVSTPDCLYSEGTVFCWLFTTVKLYTWLYHYCWSWTGRNEILFRLLPVELANIDSSIDNSLHAYLLFIWPISVWITKRYKQGTIPYSYVEIYFWIYDKNLIKV